MKKSCANKTYLTVSLITLRNNERYKALFAQTDKNCGAKNRLFGRIGEEMGIGLEAAVIGDKYRDLLSTYKTKKALSNRSGNGSVNWKYLDIFDEALGGDIEIDHPGKVEAGGALPPIHNDLLDEEDGFIAGVPKILKKKESKMSEKDLNMKVLELQAKALNKLIEKDDSEKSELDKINILEGKIEIIDQDMKELKEMLGGFLSKYN